MNARIIEMAIEAGFNPVNCTGSNIPLFEKFAQLIVKECADVCNQRARSAPMGSDEQCEAEDCAHAMIKHFGVE